MYTSSSNIYWVLELPMTLHLSHLFNTWRLWYLAEVSDACIPLHAKWKSW